MKSGCRHLRLWWRGGLVLLAVVVGLRGQAPAVAAEAGSGMDGDIAAVEALIAEAEFNDALKSARALRGKYRTDPRIREIDMLNVRVSDLRRAAMEFPQALENLASESGRTVALSSRMLAEGGEVGRILLRKGSRSDNDRIAAACIGLLGQMPDTNSVPLFQKQFLARPSKVRQIALRDALGRMTGALTGEFLAELSGRIQTDDGWNERDCAELLVMAYLQTCRREKGPYNALVKHAAGAYILGSYITAAMSSPDKALADWARRQAASAGFQQQGLRGSYFAGTGFETLVFEQLDSEINIAANNYPFPDGRKENLSIRWSGFLLVPTAGRYTIYSASDDGQRVWVDEKMIIDDWNSHAFTEQSGVCDLSPGAHTFRVEYMQGGGDGAITVSWEGPETKKDVIKGGNLTVVPWAGMKVGGTTRQMEREAVPVLQNLLLERCGGYLRAAALGALYRDIGKVETGFLRQLLKELGGDTEFVKTCFAELLAAAFGSRARFTDEEFDRLLEQPGGAAALKAYIKRAENSGAPERAAWAKSMSLSRLPGLRGAYYEGVEFNKLLHEQLDTCIDIPDRQYPIPGGRADNLSARWTGFLVVPADGKYTIYSASDDGQRVWVNGKLVMDDWTYHGITEVSAVLDLSAGEHELKVEHMQGTGGGSIQVQWSGPGIQKQVIPSANLRTLPWAGMGVRAKE